MAAAEAAAAGGGSGSGMRMAGATLDAMVSLEHLDWTDMQHVLRNHNEHRRRRGVALIGWIGMLVEIHEELCERVWLRIVHHELIFLSGLDAWIGIVDTELFYARIKMRYIATQRSNTSDGELSYEC